ncbi:MAG: hypothetical protein ABI203_04235 [Mucilaginibacter sp.]
MKSKLLVLFAVFLLIVGYACKKDGNGAKINGANIVGKWSTVKTVMHYEKDTTINGTASDYYNFAADGSLTVQDHYNGVLTGIYSQTSSNKVGITIYTVDGHGLGVTTPPSVYTISSLGANNITITSPTNPAGQEIVYLQKN